MYSIAIYVASIILNSFGLFHKKLKLGILGRKQTFKKLQANISTNDAALWFHCASLGEYEQGLPVFKRLKNLYPNHKVVLSFFSPSGYEIRKNSEIADVVVYLPWDTKKNAKRFLEIVNPEHIVFVKYDIWPNFLNEIKKRGHHAILISAVFRKNQLFFKWYGAFIRRSIKAFNHIFVQDKESKQLLAEIKIDKVTVSGDTRFDRVLSQLKMDNSLQFVDEFIGNSICIVCGSTWPEDDKLILPFINSEVAKRIKFIIAPHNINDSYVTSVIKQISKPTIRYSEHKGGVIQDYDVFVVDTIGLLSKIYSRADLAYVGGAAGTTGLHNILEPAVFGVPIIIGKNYKKFPEAITLINKKGVLSVSNENELRKSFLRFINNKEDRKATGKINREYIENSKHATDKIIIYFENMHE